MAIFDIIETSETTATLTSSYHNSYSYKLDLRAHVPTEYDTITHIYFEYPEHLASITLELGNQWLSFDKDTIDDLKNLPLYLTAGKYNNFGLCFIYDKSWVESLEEFVYEDEYKEVEEMGDEVTIYDGYDYHTGNIVQTRMVATGNQVKKVTKGVDVVIPTLQLHVKQTLIDAPFSVPVRQKLDLKKVWKNQKFSYEEYKKILKKKHDWKEIDEHTGYVMNEIRYISGLVGLKYTF